MAPDKNSLFANLELILSYNDDKAVLKIVFHFSLTSLSMDQLILKFHPANHFVAFTNLMQSWNAFISVIKYVFYCDLGKLF